MSTDGPEAARRLRVTLVNQFFPPDVAPTAHLAASLAAHRAAGGDEVTVVTGRGGYTGGRHADERASAGSPGAAAGAGRVRVVHLWTPGLGKERAARRLTDYVVFLAGALVRLLGLPRQDVVVSMTTPPYVVLAAVAHKLAHRGKPRVVLWSMDVYPDAVERFGPVRRAGLAARLLRRVNRWVLGHVDEVVVLDDAMADLVRAQAGAGRSAPVTVIPNWEELTAHPTAPAAPWEGYASPALRDRFVVLYLGNLGLGHRPDAVVEAADRLRDEPGVAFLFMGGGVRWDALAGEVAARRLAHVVLEPYVPKEQTPSVLAGAGCSLILLDDAALGVMSPSKLHASLAMGRPILYVGPAGSNVDDAVTRYTCGVSLRAGDVDGIVSAVRRLRDDPAWREELSANARRAFETAYSDAVTLPRFDALLTPSLL